MSVFFDLESNFCCIMVVRMLADSDDERPSAKVRRISSTVDATAPVQAEQCCISTKSVNGSDNSAYANNATSMPAKTKSVKATAKAKAKAKSVRTKTTSVKQLVNPKPKAKCKAKAKAKATMVDRKLVNTKLPDDVGGADHLLIISHASERSGHLLHRTVGLATKAHMDVTKLKERSPGKLLKDVDEGVVERFMKDESAINDKIAELERRKGNKAYRWAVSRPEHWTGTKWGWGCSLCATYFFSEEFKAHAERWSGQKHTFLKLQCQVLPKWHTLQVHSNSGFHSSAIEFETGSLTGAARPKSPFGKAKVAGPKFNTKGIPTVVDFVTL